MARIVRQQRVKFDRIAVPRLVRAEIDFTDINDGKGTSAPAIRGDEWEDALVKPVVTYREEDGVLAGEALAAVMVALRRGTRHVFPAEKRIVRANRVREERMVKSLSPLEAFRLWMDGRKEDVERFGRGDLEALFSERAGHAEVSQPLAARRFALRGLGVENYIPFAGKHEVLGLERGVYGIVGVYGDNARRSNRAGKSALLKSVLTAMFGDDRAELTRGESVDRDIHAGKDRYRVAVQMDVGGEPLGIVRERGQGGKTLCYLDDAKCSVTNLNSLVLDKLGFTKDDFTKIAFVRAGDLNGIVGSGNAQMKSDLLRWLGLEHWERIHGEIKRERLELGRSIDHAVASIGEMMQEVEQIEADAINLKKHGDVERGVRKLREKESLILESIAEKRAGLEASRLRIEREGLVSKLRNEIVAREFYGAMYPPAKLRVAVEEQLSEARTLREQLRSGMIKAETISDGKRRMEERFLETRECPLCEELICPAGSRLVSAIEGRTEEESKRRSAEVEAKGKLAMASREVTRLEDLLVDVDGHLTRANVYRERIEQIDARLHGVRDEGSDGGAGELGEQLKGIRSEIAAGEEILVSMRQNEERLGRLMEKSNSASTRLALEQEKDRRLAFIVRACGRDGIPTMLLENALSAIEVGANAVLEMVEAPHRVAFSFQRELKKLEDECSGCGASFAKPDRKCSRCGAERGNKRSEDISLEIIDSNGRTQDFTQDSSGGRALAALALRVALAQHFGFGVLFLDEVCASLDDENLDMLIRLLERLTDSGFEQVFVISHRQRVRDLLDRLIVVERDSDAGVSKFFLQR